MRAITIVVRPEEGFHPANEALADEPSVRRVAVHHVQLLDDGSVVLLYELRGDLERAERILRAHPDVVSCDVSGGPTGIVFIHARPTITSRSLLELPKTYELALDTPIEHAEHGGVRLTFIGEDSVLQRALSAVPPDIEVTVERIEPYERASLRGPSLLTERQREIAEHAVRSGYYDSPREVTQAELARGLGISTGTLAEHLQKIEARVFEQLFA